MDAITAAVADKIAKRNSNIQDPLVYKFINK